MSAEPEQSLSPVDVFAPWAGAEERALRLRMHRAQSTALARASREKNRRARETYYVAAELAGRWVFTRVKDKGDLERILWALCQLFMAAGHIVAVEGQDEG